MLPREVQADFLEIRRKLDCLRSMKPDHAGDIQSMAAQYLCVAIAGKLEQGLKLVLQDYVKIRSNVSLDRAIDRICQGFQNPKPEKILELVDAFDRRVKSEITAEWVRDDGRVQESIKALVSTRINIAHQKIRSSRVTIEALEDYFSAYKSVISSVHQKINRFAP